MPATTYEPIATTTLGSDTASYTFSSIPATYTDLILIVNLQSTYTGDAGNGARLRFNSDTNNNYSSVLLRGTSTSNQGLALNTGTGSGSYIQLGLLPSSGGSTPSDTLGTGIAHIQNYTNTNMFKTVIGRTASTHISVEASVGLWRSLSAIDSITYFGDSNMKTGGTLTLYGILAA